jgi:hypothetical protein
MPDGPSPAASPPGREQLTALRAQHPQWRIWRSDEGRFYATRYGLQPGAPGQGCTADSGTALGLHDAIVAAEADAAAFSSAAS